MTWRLLVAQEGTPDSSSVCCNLVIRSLLSTEMKFNLHFPYMPASCYTYSLYYSTKAHISRCGGAA